MRRYGWTKSHAEDAGNCIVEVYHGPAGSCQCGNKRGHGPKQEYCVRHAKMLEQGRCVAVPKDKD